MVKKIIYILLLISFVSESFAQKVLQKEWDASGISKLVIESDEVFNIKITSEKTNTIKIDTHVEGENYEDVVLGVIEKEKSLILNTGYSPYFEAKNDKLAAHKVIAIEMEVTLPETMMVSIRSGIASVEGYGSFKSFEAGLESGNCILYNFRGNALLQTKQGAITVYAKENVKGKAISKRGIIHNTLPMKGKYTINAESIDGTIRLIQNK